MVVNEENFMLYAAKHYELKNSSTYEEFEDDLKRIQYIKRLFNRYESKKDLRIRLILNHIIILYNCFDNAATPMLFMKLYDQHYLLKPFLLYVNRLPKLVIYGESVIDTDTISMDNEIIKELRKI